MMRLRTLGSIFVSTMLIASSISNAMACTTLLYTDANGRAYVGKSMEFSAAEPDHVTYYPAGTHFASLTPDAKPGLAFNTKFAILSTSAKKGIIPNDNHETLLDAMNDQGLTLSMQSLGGNISPDVSRVPQGKIISAADFGSWALGNFTTVSQVKKAIENKDVEFWLPVSPILGPTPFPVHYALFDRSGAGIVVEWASNKTEVYDNPVGVMTNNPPFPWHLQNMNNFSYLTNIDKNSATFGKLKVASFDGGANMAGLPGLETSAGRFVKAAYYSTFAEKSSTPEQAIITLGHVMSNFDRPKNISVDLANDMPGGERNMKLKIGPKGVSEMTIFMILRDLSQNHYYIRTYNALNYTKFDMSKLSGLKEVKSVSFKSLDANPMLDGTNLFLK